MTPVIRLYPPACRRSSRVVPASYVLAMILWTPAMVAAQQTTSARDDQANESAQAHPGLWPAMQSPVAKDAGLERRVRQLLAKMSVEEKVGQVVQGDIASVTPEDVRKYRLGSVLAGGNSDPGNDFRATAAQWVALADAYYQASMDTSDGHEAIPVLFGIDAVHGHNNLVGATLFPHNIGLGAARDPELMREIAAATAVELRATGLDWTFAPTLAVPRDDRWGRTYEGYSENPEIVALYAGPLVEGLQGKVNTKSFLSSEHVVATAKHFLGDGGTYEGRDQGDAKVSEEELRDVHGAGYPPALRAGVQAVMASFSSWNGSKMHGNESLLTEVLKKRMGFDGFVVGDWNAHGQLPGCSNTDCPAAFNAGVDMMMTPDSWRGYYESTLRHVKSGEIPMERLDDAVARILRVKMRAGLFEAGRPSQRALAGKANLLGDEKHRAIARRAVRESLVLLKNQNGILPLDPKATILVAGDGADDVGKQSGGWTLTWQGTGLQAADFPNAQSIWSGIAQQVAAAGGKAVLSVAGKYETRPDVAVVVFGEDPYAEFQGDIKTVAYKPNSNVDLDLIKRLKGEGIPVVGVFLSGRPLWVNREINASDAFVAAWLPGSEGGGIADVLLREKNGKAAHNFSGRLSYSWPRSAAQSPVNEGTGDQAPQFVYGYGLKYGEEGNVGALSEDPGLDLSAVQSAHFFEKGALAKGWRVRVTHDGTPTYFGSLAESKNAGLAIAAVDHNAQEDAWRYQWLAGASSSVAFVPAETLDLSRETNGDVLLSMILRIEADTPDDTSLFVECGTDCKGRVLVGPQITLLPRNQWLRVGIPLKCFAVAGADMGKLTTAAGFESRASFTVTISEIGYGTVADHLLGCGKP